MTEIRRVDLSPAEWIAGTLGMSLEEEAIYVRIVMRIYNHGGALPADPAELARLCGVRPQTMRRILPKLMGKFVETDGKLTSNRCETELKLARNRIETRRINGAKGGRPNGLEEPAGCSPRAGARNYQPSTINHHKDPPLLGPPPKAAAARQKPRRQFPPDWQPDDQDVAFALREGQDTGWIAVQAEQCRDFHRAKGNLFADLRAAWRTWVRKAGEIEQSRKAKLNGKTNAHDEETAAFERASRFYSA